MSQWAEIRHLHLVEGVPKEEIARRLQTGRQDGAPRRRPVDAAGAGVAAEGRQPGPVAGPDRAVAAGGPEVDREAGPPVVAAVGRRGLPAHGAPLRRGAAEACHLEGGLRAPQRGSRHDDGGRLRRVVGRHRQRAVQGEVPGGDAAVLERVLREGVPRRAARVVARRHRVGLPLLGRHRRARGPR